MLARTLIASVFFAFAGANTASACEFHGGGFGPYGSYYKPYYGDTHQNSLDADQLSDWASSQLETDAQKTERQLFARRPATRPSFSNAASRAANTAKDRIHEDENSSDLNVVDQADQAPGLNSDG